SYFVHRTSYPLTSYRPHPLPYPHDLLPPHHRPPLPPRRRRPLEYRRLLHQGDRRRRHQHHLLPLPLRRPTACPRRGRPPIPRGPDIVVSIVLFALLLGLYVGATKETTAANAIFLQYTAPLYVIAFAPALLGER